MIKCVIFDTDGVHTDGTVVYEEDGERHRAFNVRDGAGVAMLKRSGVEVWMISGEEDYCIKLRARKLDVLTALGQKDKMDIFKRLGPYQMEEVAYMGDDLADIPCLKIAGLPACPLDAVESVRELVGRRRGFISKYAGGHGAVREFCEHILALNADLVYPIRVDASAYIKPNE